MFSCFCLWGCSSNKPVVEKPENTFRYRMKEIVKQKCVTKCTVGCKPCGNSSACWSMFHYLHSLWGIWEAPTSALLWRRWPSRRPSPGFLCYCPDNLENENRNELFKKPELHHTADLTEDSLPECFCCSGTFWMRQYQMWRGNFSSLKTSRNSCKISLT